MRESEVLFRARLAFGQAEGFVLWRNNTGFDHEKNARYGVCVGGSDLLGIAPGGLFLAVEAKGLRGRPTDEQMRFLKLVFDHGGVSCLVGPDDSEQEMIRGIRAGIRRHGW